MWQAKPDFLAYDVRLLPSALPAALRSKGVPVVSWTVRQLNPDEAEQIGRNDPCWCGSGKKFKKCHGA